MKDSRRTIRMIQRHKQRTHKPASFGLVSLLDIFTILILFLLVSTTDSDIISDPRPINLSQSDMDTQAKQNITIKVDQDHLLLQGKVVLDIQSTADYRGPVIPELIKALKSLDATTGIHTERQALSERGITIRGNKTLRYKLLKKIILSCVAANYSNISLAVTPGARA